MTTEQMEENLKIIAETKTIESPKIYKRLENGLIEGIEYIRDSNNKIDWFRMIPPEYLYINNERKAVLEKRLSKPFNEIQISEVNDSELVLNLNGIRFLLNLRGYKYSKIRIDAANSEYAAATCEICYIPNEEENFEQIFTASASAHVGNTKSWYRNYLIEASSNRALCRAVRFYLLKSNIVSSEELSGSGEPEEQLSTSITDRNLQHLKDTCKELSLSFADLKEKCIKDKIDGAEDWKTPKDIPMVMVFKLIGMLKEELRNKKK